MNDLNEFQKQVVITAVKHMFKGNYFDICTVDKCIKIIGCIPDKADYQALNALHCIHWNEMTHELRNIVMLKTVQMLDAPTLDASLLDGMFKNATKQLV